MMLTEKDCEGLPASELGEKQVPVKEPHMLPLVDTLGCFGIGCLLSAALGLRTGVGSCPMAIGCVVNVGSAAAVGTHPRCRWCSCRCCQSVFTSEHSRQLAEGRLWSCGLPVCFPTAVAARGCRFLPVGLRAASAALVQNHRNSLD